GNDLDALEHALDRAEKSSRPVFIQCKNVLGRGSSLANKSSAHGFALSETEMLSLIAKNANAEGLRLWNVVKRRPIGEPVRAVSAIKRARIPKVPEKISSRELSGIYLDLLMKNGADLIIGSADLSNNTNVKTSGAKEITPDNFNGNFINYGVREHAMGAIMNGLCVDGVRSVGSTFLVFSDYMRPAIRLAALSHLPAIYVFSHDSVAVGEDGPTHQPIEQLPSLRLIPNLNVYRPCNITEIAHAWNSAIGDMDNPSAIILSRQKFRQIPTPTDSQLSRGAYVICPAKSGRVNSTLVATGSEIPLAVEIASRFKGIQVVSMVNVNDFRKQDEKYKSSILRGCVIAIEAAAPSSWFEFADAVIGIDKFGASGDGETLYREYGFDVDKIIKEIKKYVA
ncbi:MAG: transketolase, partial [Alphaproteobacteria bacterium]|nr:transketolase [Alphaproteobacteria bacterium]